MMVNTILYVDIEIDDDGDCYASFEDENGNRYENQIRISKKKLERLLRKFWIFENKLRIFKIFPKNHKLFRNF